MRATEYGNAYFLGKKSGVGQEFFGVQRIVSAVGEESETISDPHDPVALPVP